MAGNIYGFDLGTYEIKVYDKKGNEIRCVKNVIAMKDGRDIFAVGDKAYEIYEKAPADIKVVFPMRNGAIARFDDMQYLLGTILKPDRKYIGGARYLVAVPTDVTEVEKRAFYDLVFHSQVRAKSVRIVERGIADAIGSGVDLMNEKGVFIVNLGGDTTELSVLGRGGMVMNRLLKTGGHDHDKAIVTLVRHNMEFLIGNSTAEILRRTFGIFTEKTERFLNVSGRDLITGMPAQRDVPVSLVRAAMKEPLEECVKAIRSMIGRTPPDVRRAIEEKGIHITGGMANLRGIALYLQEYTGLRVLTTDHPELCAVRGLQKIISDRSYFEQLTYSMRDKDYRWLR